MVPLNRVQFAKTTSNIFERPLKLASVHIYTSGSDAGDATISGLPAEEAERIKDFVLRRAGDAGENKNQFPEEPAP